jgi:hypothetical protein
MVRILTAPDNSTRKSRAAYLVVSKPANFKGRSFIHYYIIIITIISIIIIIIIIIRSELGHGKLISSSSNTLFKVLPSRLLPFGL